MKLQKEIIQLENILGCRSHGSANYLYQNLLKVEDVLSVKVNLDQGGIEIYCKGKMHRSDYIRLLAKAGYPEVGTGTKRHKGKAIVNSFIGMFL